jgi:hypothetical protein
VSINLVLPVSSELHNVAGWLFIGADNALNRETCQLLAVQLRRLQLQVVVNADTTS